MTLEEQEKLKALQAQLAAEAKDKLPFWEKADQVLKEGVKICVIPFCETGVYAKKLCTKHYQYMRQDRLDPLTGGILYKRDQAGNPISEDLVELPNMGKLDKWVYIGQTQEFINKERFKRMSLHSAIGLDGPVVKTLIRHKKFDVRLYQQFCVYNPNDYATAEREGYKLDPPCPLDVFNTFMPERIMWASGVTGDRLSEPLDMLLRTLSGYDYENRMFLEKWLSFLFKNMSVLGSALIIKGTHGTGKSILGALLCTILGQYATTIRVRELESNHNSWVEDKLLVVGEEMNQGAPNEQKRIINELKQYISGGVITVNRKMVAQYNSDIFARWILFSNAALPLIIEPTERRYSIIEALTPLERSIGREIDENRKKYAQELLNYLHTVDTRGFGAWDVLDNEAIVKAKKESEIYFK